MEFEIKEAKLILALVEERIEKAHDPFMRNDLLKLKQRLETFLKENGEL